MCITKIAGVCVLAAQLTGGGVTDYPMPEVATSYDGKERNVARFYKAERPTFNIEGGILFDTDTLVHIAYDNGYDSQKYDQSRTATVHVTQGFTITDDLSLKVTVGHKFGGDIRESSCTDSYNRQYYCGNLTAWSDYTPKTKQDYSMGKVQLKYRF